MDEAEAGPIMAAPTSSGRRSAAVARTASRMAGSDVRRDRRIVADAMLSHPKRLSLAATVRDVRRLFHDDHVHAALIVPQAGLLVAVVERCDVVGSPAPDDARAAPLGRLAGRIVEPVASLRATWLAMTASGQRRKAVISADGRLLGLLCLKASHAGFCSDEDVADRARELKALATAPQPPESGRARRG